MVEENRVTIFTDFDKTMIKNNSPKSYALKHILRKPSSRIIRAIKTVIKSKGNLSKAEHFLHLVCDSDKQERKNIAQSVAQNLKFNKKWLRHINAFVKKYPNIKILRIIIITRNLELVPKYFFEINNQENLRILTHSSHHKCRGKHDIQIIGNKCVGETARYAESEKQFMNLIIENNKVMFTRKDNVFWWGNEDDFEQLKKHPRFKNSRLYFTKF